MINKILSNEITDSVEGVLKNRLSSPIYGTFFVSWFIFHWNFIFTMFFVSEEKIWQSTHLLKNEYLKQTFFNYHIWTFYLYWILPFFVTWLVIWIFPRWISLPAFKKEEEYRAAKKRIRIVEQRKLETEEIKLEQKNIKKLEVVSQKTQKEKEIEDIDPTIVWEEEYRQFKESPFFKEFRYIVTAVYEKNGNMTETDVGFNVVFKIPRDIMAYAHTNNLININENFNKITLTDKGKFFVKKYSLETTNK